MNLPNHQPAREQTRSYAIIGASGSQYLVHEGDEIDLVGLRTEEIGSEIPFRQVLLVSEQGKIQIGTPHIKGTQVNGSILLHFRGEKIRVAVYRAKSRSRRVKGHRDNLTRVKINHISSDKKMIEKSIQK